MYLWLVIRQIEAHFDLAFVAWVAADVIQRLEIVFGVFELLLGFFRVFAVFRL